MRADFGGVGWAAALLGLFGVADHPDAALAATADEAQAFSERAAAHIEQVGEEKAFADFTRLHHPHRRGHRKE